MPFLEVKNLSYIYSKKTAFRKEAVKNVSFSAERGEIIGIIGHTGSGKSTLVQMLNGLIKPDDGTVLLDGTDIFEDPKKLPLYRYKIGIVFQYPEYQLFEETVYKDISFGPSNMGLLEENKNRRVLEAAQMVGLDTDLLEKSPFDLSGGQKRRAAIAGVIAMFPEVIIFDEPTAGLDPEGRETIFAMIKEYAAKNNAAVIIVSHSMEDMARYADRILVLNDGEVVMFDQTEKVFAKHDTLSKIGLNVPQITDVFLKLKALGVNISTDVFTVKQAVAAVKSLLKGGEGID